MKTRINNFPFYTILNLLVFIFFAASLQSCGGGSETGVYTRVLGEIKDNNGLPVPFAIVVEPVSGAQSLTDAEGSFNIEFSRDDATVVLDVTVEGESTYSITVQDVPESTSKIQLKIAVNKKKKTADIVEVTFDTATPTPSPTAQQEASHTPVPSATMTPVPNTATATPVQNTATAIPTDTIIYDL